MLVFAFGLMLVAFRSPVIAAKAIVLNLLSVGAAYGVLVLVFQHGFGKGLFGFSSTAGIDPVVPLLLFVILFGLSMDYHVFLLSRIREAVQRGMPTDEAVAHGIKSTAGVVTSAAIVMVAVFAVFIALSMLMFKQFGVGLAAAILIDATIVRGVLLPASMKLLGDWNWYLPSWLEWLPRFDVSEGEVPEAAPDPHLRLDPTGQPRARRGPGGDRERSRHDRFLRQQAEPGLHARSNRRPRAHRPGCARPRLPPRSRPSDDAVSVPTGAQAGDLILESCDYATEDGSYAADCGTLVVPENRADPDSRLIALPVTRIKARSNDPAEPIFRLQGGPGLTNMEFSRASRFADDHDVVLVGYRGVDGSVRLDCPEVVSALKHSTDFLGEASFRAYGDGLRACADRLTDDGVDLAGYGLPQQVDDLEAARVALGYDRIDLVSESAGTRTAMIYSWRYPESIHRSVMIAVNPPGHFLWDAKTTDEQIGRYAALCAKDDSCSSRTDDLAASMQRTAADIPDRWFFLPIKDGNVRVASFWGLMETTADAAEDRSRRPMTLGSWLSAADGDASGFWFQSLLADLAFPESFVWGQMAAAARLDAQAASDSFSSGSLKPDSNLGDAATAFIWGGGRMADAWPAVARRGRVPHCARRRTSRRCSSAGSSTSRRRRRPRRRSSSRTCRTATRSSCPDSGIRAPSGRSSRRQVPT